MIFRALVLHHLRAERLRSLMTLVAVALGTALVFAIDLANGTAVSSFSRSVDLVARKVNLQVVGFGAGFDDRVFGAVAALPGVRDAHPVVEGSLTIGARAHDPTAGDVLHVIGTDVLRALPAGDGASDAGGAAAGGARPASFAAMLVGDGAIVGDRIARRLNLRVGSPFVALDGDRLARFVVAGVVPPGAPGIDSSVVFVDVSTAQERFGRVGRLDRIDLEVDPARLSAVEGDLRALRIASARVVTPATRDAEIERMLRSFTVNLEALAVVALLVGVFLVGNTVGFSVVRRRAEIGTLRGLGVDRAAVTRAFLLEGALFGVAGAALGLVAGALLAQSAVGAVSKTVASLYVSTHADGVVYAWPAFVKALLLGVGSAVAAAVVPARAAATVAPAALMRVATVEPKRLWSTRRSLGAAALCAAVGLALARLPALDGIPVFGYLAGFAAILCGALLSPVAVHAAAVAIGRLAGRAAAPRLAAAQMDRARGRVGVAVATLMTAIAMMVSIAVLVSSFRSTVTAWADESLRADFFVKPLGLVDASLGPVLRPDVVARLRRAPGVEALDTIRAFAIPFRGRTTTVAGVEMAALLRRPRLRILAGDPRAAAADLRAGRAAIVSEPFATRFGTRVGDTLLLPAGAGVASLTVAAIYNDYSSDNGIVLVDRAETARLYRDDGVDSVAIALAPGVDRETARRAILRAAAPARVDVESTRELRTYVVAVFDRTFAITYALDVIAVVIATLGVLTTLFALALERRRELGILRCVGLSRGGARAMVLVEAGGIGVLGGALGVTVGLGLAFDLIYVINRQSFGWLIELAMPWGFLAWTGLGVVAAAVLAGLIPAGGVARLRVAEALRDE